MLHVIYLGIDGNLHLKRNLYYSNIVTLFGFVTFWCDAVGNKNI